jgi:hypothetical protein
VNQQRAVEDVLDDLRVILLPGIRSPSGVP